MATDQSQPPPYSQVVSETSKDQSKVPLNSSPPPQYSSPSPSPYIPTTSPPHYNCITGVNTPSLTYKQDSVNAKSKRKESFKELEQVNPESTQVYEKKSNHRKILLGVGTLVIIGVAVIIIICCCNDREYNRPAPQYLLIFSNGEAAQGAAADEWPMKMGLYNLGDTYNGYVTYAKVEHCEWSRSCNSSALWLEMVKPQRMFVDKFGKWRIYKELAPSLGGVRHPENNPTPSLPPEKGWMYKEQGEGKDWKLDVTLRVTEPACSGQFRKSHYCF